jgi:hypothetical protein
MCGGPSQQQKDAATAQANLSSTEAGIAKQDQAAAFPVLSDQAKNGLPFFQAESQYATSNLAKQVNQQKAQLAARNAGYGGALPSGFAESENRDLASSAAENFDQNQLGLLQAQQQAKVGAAGALLGQQQGSSSTAATANNTIMQAPLQNNFWSNLVQGIIRGGAQVGSAYVGA